MSHFAEIENGVVLRVIVIEREMLNTGRWGDPSRWVKTERDGSIRMNYAGIGYTFDAQRDAFIPPKPYSSWTLNEKKCQWQAPVQCPTDGKMYSWNEPLKKWVQA